ncbi:MAG: hypothetical protein EBS18_00615 [Actinobacteria bacterium]|nr:hypothetical protein [Actinomycetota bacterium]
MLYSKNGSIPKPQTDGTDGWVEVPEPPVAPEGMETVWWDHPGWVVRPIKPAAEEGFVWKWSQSEEQWNKYAIQTDADIVAQENIILESYTGSIVLGGASATIV